MLIPKKLAYEELFRLRTHSKPRGQRFEIIRLQNYTGLVAEVLSKTNQKIFRHATAGFSLGGRVNSQITAGGRDGFDIGLRILRILNAYARVPPRLTV
ncbi:hypothetical protein CEXT_744601 [Caerostris extrusa]|uniref:Uncharacterized protein n=1 Tax=Caerostris extrusa TaxID=172846 RepID=A0AAV4MIU5_CAEEX|nr:hypothetical protein CEXT_744601 [Caerostris extrusa]